MNKIIGYVAGTVDCSYPSPVNGSSIDDVISFHDSCHDLYRVSVVISNYYDENKKFIPACISGKSEFRSNFEMDNTVGRGFYFFNAFLPFSSSEIVRIQENNFRDFINKIMEKCKGTLHISFYELNSWRGKENVKEFSLLSSQ